MTPTKLDEALITVTPVTELVGIESAMVKNTLIILSQRGRSGAESGKLLRKTLKELQNEHS